VESTAFVEKGFASVCTKSALHPAMALYNEYLGPQGPWDCTPIVERPAHNNSFLEHPEGVRKKREAMSKTGSCEHGCHPRKPRPSSCNAERAGPANWYKKPCSENASCHYLTNHAGISGAHRSIAHPAPSHKGRVPRLCRLPLWLALLWLARRRRLPPSSWWLAVLGPAPRECMTDLGTGKGMRPNCTSIDRPARRPHWPA
jgi:hypothetical protein